uniref:Uncharacterized protein n=1 Tax=Aegilops tauschii subsp. strangulata TaxID=200361 RepID=A0A453MWE8_AEGTS
MADRTWRRTSEKTSTHGGMPRNVVVAGGAPTGAAPAGRPPSGARRAGDNSHLHRATAAPARSFRRQEPPGHSRAAAVKDCCARAHPPAQRLPPAAAGRGGRRGTGGLGQKRAAQIWAPSSLPLAAAAGRRHSSATAHAFHTITASPERRRPPALPPRAPAAPAHKQPRASSRTRAPLPPSTGEGFARRYPPVTARGGRGGGEFEV